jgi:hypothetical protein
MPTEILDADPDTAGTDVIESPQTIEEQRRKEHNQEVLAAIEENMRRLQQAFVRLDACRKAEAELADEVRKAESEESRISKDEDVSVPTATKKLVEARAKKDVLVARHTAGRQRTAIAIEDVLELGRIVRRNCVHLGAALLTARRARLLEFANDFWGPPFDSGLPISSVALVEASKPYKELLYFTNTVHMEQRQDKDEELAELATAPDRWFTGLKDFIPTEPALDLSSVYLGEH